MQTLFISDLHLCSTRPDKLSTFETFLSSLNNDTDAVYILGDLFEFWHGDDDLSEFNKKIIQAIAAVSAKGIPVFFQHGNRDFLAGKVFAEITGITLLPDYKVIDLYGTKTLIMHGDLLCTDDVSYLRMRRIFNLKWGQWIFLHIPLLIRRIICARLRDVSLEKNKDKPPSIMDVSQGTVEQMLEYYKVNELIHGHTHRPAIHAFDFYEGTARRIVLGDWYESDSVLVYRKDQQRLMSVAECLNTA